MAKIIVTIEEIIGVLEANGWMSRRVSELQGVDGGVTFKVDTGMPLIGAVKLQINYKGFDGRHAELEVIGGGLLDRLSGLITGALTPPDHIQLDYPKILIDVEALIRERVRGLDVESVVLEGTTFTVGAKVTT